MEHNYVRLGQFAEALGTEPSKIKEFMPDPVPEFTAAELAKLVAQCREAEGLRELPAVKLYAELDKDRMERAHMFLEVLNQRGKAVQVLAKVLGVSSGKVLEVISGPQTNKMFGSILGPMGDVEFYGNGELWVQALEHGMRMAEKQAQTQAEARDG